MTKLTKAKHNAILASLTDAKKNIEASIRTFAKGLYLASYANLNMGVAAGCKAQEIFSRERQKSMLEQGFATCKEEAKRGSGKKGAR